MAAMIPDPEQEAVIESITPETTGSLIAGDMGTGKTLIGTEIIKRRGHERVLIVCPKSTRGTANGTHGWAGTLRQQGVALPITIVKNRDHLPQGPFTSGVWIVTRESVAAYRRETKTKPGYDWGAARWGTVVYDEIHAIANRKSQAYDAAREISSELRIGLSGTPFRTRFSGLWSVTRWLWPDRVQPGFWSWAYKWARVENLVVMRGGKPKKVRITNFEKSPGAYVAALPNYHRLTRTRRAVFRELEVDLTPEQKRMYEHMKAKMLARVEGGILVADLPITQRMRLREMTLGTLSIDEEDRTYYEADTKSAKLDALAEYLDGHPADEAPVLVFTHSKKFAKIAALRFPGAELWTGDTPDAEREAIKERFLAGESHLLFATIDSFGTGTDGFQERSSTVIFLSRSESPTDNDQAIGRLDRRGQDDEMVLVLDIVARDTYDQEHLLAQNAKLNAAQRTMKGTK